MCSLLDLSTADKRRSISLDGRWMRWGDSGSSWGSGYPQLVRELRNRRVRSGQPSRRARPKSKIEELTIVDPGRCHGNIDLGAGAGLLSSATHRNWFRAPPLARPSGSVWRCIQAIPRSPTGPDRLKRGTDIKMCNAIHHPCAFAERLLPARTGSCMHMQSPSSTASSSRRCPQDHKLSLESGYSL